MILVTGATGKLGKGIIDHLLTKVPATEITALVRDTAKAEDLAAKGISLRTGDYFDYNSLVAAFKNTDQLMFISSGTMDDRTGQQLNVVNAAKEAGVEHIIYTSFTNNTQQSKFVAGDSHVATEEAIKASGINYTILRNNLYMDVLPMIVGNAIETGSFQFPAGDGRISLAARADMAEAAANVLTSEGHDNTVYDITGTGAHSLNDVAATLQQVTGKQVTYTDVPETAYVEGLIGYGMPATHAQILGSMGTAIREGEFEAPGNTLQQLLNREPVSLQEYMKGVYANN